MRSGSLPDMAWIVHKYPTTCQVVSYTVARRAYGGYWMPIEVDAVLVHPGTRTIRRAPHLRRAGGEVEALLHTARCHRASWSRVSEPLRELCEWVAVRVVAANDGRDRTSARSSAGAAISPGMSAGISARMPNVDKPRLFYPSATCDWTWRTTSRWSGSGTTWRQALGAASVPRLGMSSGGSAAESERATANSGLPRCFAWPVSTSTRVST